MSKKRVYPIHGLHALDEESSAWRARLLSLDRRQVRIGFADGSLQQRYQKALRRESELRWALHLLLAWHDAPPQGWTAGMVRRLDEIRALATTP